MKWWFMHRTDLNEDTYKTHKFVWFYYCQNDYNNFFILFEIIKDFILFSFFKPKRHGDLASAIKAPYDLR